MNDPQSAPSHPQDHEVAIVEQTIRFSFTGLCHASQASDAQLHALIDEGLLAPQGRGPSDWVFDGSALGTTRIALRLANDLQLGIAATAVVLDLLADNAALRSRLHRIGQR